MPDLLRHRPGRPFNHRCGRLICRRLCRRQWRRPPSTATRRQHHRTAWGPMACPFAAHRRVGSSPHRQRQGCAVARRARSFEENRAWACLEVVSIWSWTKWSTADDAANRELCSIRTPSPKESSRFQNERNDSARSSRVPWGIRFQTGPNPQIFLPEHGSWHPPDRPSCIESSCHRDAVDGGFECYRGFSLGVGFGLGRECVFGFRSLSGRIENGVWSVQCD